MSNPSNTPQSPNAQSHGEHDARKAEPPSSLVAFKQRLGALLVFVFRLCCDVGSDDCNEAQANGLSDLRSISMWEGFS